MLPRKCNYLYIQWVLFVWILFKRHRKSNWKQIGIKFEFNSVLNWGTYHLSNHPTVILYYNYKHWILYARKIELARVREGYCYEIWLNNNYDRHQIVYTWRGWLSSFDHGFIAYANLQITLLTLPIEMFWIIREICDYTTCNLLLFINTVKWNKIQFYYSDIL